MNFAATNLKVLMIGNSFSICVGRNLPQLVAHENKHSLELTNAYIGGCKFIQHAENLRKAEEDNSFKPYTINTWTSKDLRKTHKRKGNVNELLKNNQYNIITIQQGSLHSFDYNLYQPYANELIAYIKKYNPQAEIVIQETWSYRADAPFLQNNNMSQSEMTSKIIDAYNKFAKETKSRLIPTGRAVEIARKNPTYQYKILSEEELSKFVCPDLPPRAHDVVGKHFWAKTDNGMQLLFDTIHLNEHGEYLQACVWYSFLFRENAENITYEARLNPENIKILRSAAAQAIKEYK